MAKDITIKNPQGTVTYYPKTVSQLVYDNESGKTVKEDIDELLNTTEQINYDYISETSDNIIFKTNEDDWVGTIDDNGANFSNLKRNNENVITELDLKTVNGSSIIGRGENLEVTIDGIENTKTAEETDSIIIGEDKTNPTIVITNGQTDFYGEVNINGESIQKTVTIEEITNNKINNVEGFNEYESVIIGQDENNPTVVITDGQTDFFGDVKINGVPISSDVVEDGKENVQNLGITDYQRPTKDINMLAIYGQSLSTGQQTCPELSRINYRGNLMIGEFEWVANQANISSDATFIPLKARSINALGNDYIPTSTSDQTNGETCGVNTCNAMKRLIDDYLLETVDRKFLDCSFGAGGRSIELLSKDCPNNGGSMYIKLENAMDIIKNRADSDNKSICCTAVIWMQGEWNESTHEDMGWFDGEYSTTNKDDYKAYLIGGTTTEDVTVNGMVNDLIDTIKTKFNQENAPIIIGSQMGTNYIRFKELPIMMAQLEASHETDKYIVCTPSYRVTDRGGHLDSNGERWLGELYAKVWYKVVILGEKWKPLEPISITRKNTKVEIEFHVPQPPLVFDTHQVRSVNNYGFEVFLNNTAVTITNVSISGNKVILQTNKVLDGDLEVSYAGNSYKYGNLRDSDDWKSFEVYKDLDTIVENPQGVSYHPNFEPIDEDGNVIYNKPYPCQNFCVNFYYKLDNGINNKQIKI